MMDDDEISCSPSDPSDARKLESSDLGSRRPALALGARWAAACRTLSHPCIRASVVK